jgi:hypothetical protein
MMKTYHAIHRPLEYQESPRYKELVLKVMCSDLPTYFLEKGWYPASASIDAHRSSNIYVSCYNKCGFCSCKYLQVWRHMFNTMHLRWAVTMTLIGCIEMKHGIYKQSQEEIDLFLSPSPILQGTFTQPIIR